MNRELIPNNGNSDMTKRIDSRGDLAPKVVGEVIKGQHITYIRLHRDNSRKHALLVLGGLLSLGERIKHG